MGGPPTLEVGKNLLFGNNFAENRMKMKEFGHEGGVPGAPLDPPMFRMSMNTAVAKNKKLK